jgi:hypothetical protein
MGRKLWNFSCGCVGEQGYFRLMVIGYACGLMMANAAVYLMKMGQPALLYLVPCTLGVFCAVAAREGKLLEMWKGPPVLNPAPAPAHAHTHTQGGEGGGGVGMNEVVVAASAPPLPSSSSSSSSSVVPVLGGGGGGGVGGVGGTVAAPIEGGVRIVGGGEEDAPLLDL